MVPGENTMLVPSRCLTGMDDMMVLCIVRDMTNSYASCRTSFNLPSSYTVNNLIQEISNKYNYDPDTFILTYDCPTEGLNEEVNLNLIASHKLCNVCNNVGNNKRNNFSIVEKDGIPPTKMVQETAIDQDSRDVGLDTLNLSHPPAAPPAPAPAENREYYGPLAPSASFSSDYSYSAALIKSDTGFVGLVNQAMTCYLNSLIQTLYMTPEFRNALYRWQFEGTKYDIGAKIIPYQLQKLFLLLQTSKKRAVETTDLTRSFGWDSSEAWQQHDVQELCRVMFDALERTWKDTDQADLINKLYQGKMKDYVKCLQCGNESFRIDVYLDVPLVIRPFGSTQAYGSVQEAMGAFVQPEILDGSNQYFCEKCNKKCDAHKGLKFIKFPYLFTLQLKRFDFDYSTMHRIKLNDRVTFPEILNLNHLIENCDPVDDASSQVASKIGLDDGAVSDLDEGIDEDIEFDATSAVASSETSSASGGGLSSETAANVKNANEMKSLGPYAYELFSIMIHSGSAAGGHYYAYIKSFRDGQWYSFNDQHVNKITYDDIRKTYGGCGVRGGYYSSMYMSSTNAYMLMYRQIDKERNADFMKIEEFPPLIQQQLKQLQKQEDAENKQKELDRCTCKIKLFCDHPKLRKRVDGRLEVHKDKTLAEATDIARKLFELNDIRLECCRLVKYDEFHDSLERSFELEEFTEMGVLLGGVKSTYSFDLLLEVRQPHQKFQIYRPGGVTCKVHIVNIDEESISSAVTVRAYLTQTVTEFKNLIGEVTGLPTDYMKCVLERSSELRFLANPNKTLKGEGFVKSNKVFIEPSGKQDLCLPFDQSKFWQILDRYENTIQIFVNLPPNQAVEEFVKDQMNNISLRERALNEKKFESRVSHVHADEEFPLRDSENLPNFPTKCANNSEPDRTAVEAEDSTNSDSVSLPRSSSDTLCSSSANNGSNRASTGSDLTDVISDCSGGEQSSNLIDDNNSETLSDDVIQDDLGGAGDSFPVVDSFVIDDNVKRLIAEDSSASPTNPRVDGNSQYFDVKTEEDWDLDDRIQETSDDDEYRKYCRIDIREETEPHCSRFLTIHIDKRVTLNGLKKELERFVGTSVDNFKVFRVYANNQEFESIRLLENLSSFGDDCKLNIKLGRALQKDEYRVKVFQLQINDPEPIKFLIDTVFAKGMTVLESKKIILAELRDKLQMEIPLNRCRLRKKTWKNPGCIYLDNQVYDSDTSIPIFANWEIFVEVLTYSEPHTSLSQIAIFVRRWRPSKYELEPFSEIVLDTFSVEELKENIHEISDIPIDNVEFCKCRGTFPCEVSLLEIHNELDWNPQATSLNVFPLYICDDGTVMYYRDKTEKLTELSDERKKELEQKENVRLSRLNQRVTYSPRKERALKIYTDDRPLSSASSTQSLD